MQTSHPTLPQPLATLLSRLPQYPHSVLFAQVLNLVLPRILKLETLEPLYGKLIGIRVADAGVNFHFTVGAKGFTAVARAGEPDLTIRATAYDFLMLATRREDPDTLFFSRRLVLEGDTELGLFTKNTLDALELPLPDIGALSPDRLLPAIISRLLPRGKSAPMAS